MSNLSLELQSVTRRRLFRKAAAVGLLAAGVGGVGSIIGHRATALASSTTCGISCIGPCLCVQSNETAMSCCVGEDVDCITTTCWCIIDCGDNCAGCGMAIYRYAFETCSCLAC
jgi:hypothetical protein